ncbi:MAG: hypothetical protein ROR55_01520 [Devosia sp.]
MWPFRKTPFLDEDTAAWHLENFIWLMRHFGGGGEFHRSRLVLPKPGFFPVEGEKGHALAERLFQTVKDYCGLSDWPVDLVADNGPDSHLLEGSAMASIRSSSAVGRFAVSDEGVQISYAPRLLDRPQDLISTFAHELAHYLLATAPEDPVCEPDEYEFLTDLTAVFLGFGVFLANTRFSQDVLHLGPIQGVGWTRQGYLPERDLVFATAIFLAVKRLDPSEAADSLDSHLRSQLSKALDQLRDAPQIAELITLAARPAPQAQALQSS